tara:strand:+ start:4383 stop:5615 length:1233 start_codon:yes stop_codon:yes gene_type:complete
MSESKFLITKCMLMPSESSSLKEPYELGLGNPIIDYYESIESPSISMTVTFIDIDQVIGREGITGGEYIDLTVKDGDVDEFKITSKKQKLMLNSVRNMVTETNKQVATLEFVSVESIINETARVNKKFTGNVSNTVEELLKSDKKGVQSSKKLDKDNSVNSYSFVGNLKRPFDTIQWLCPKTQSSAKDFGFLFYETLDGYIFKSIKSLLKQEPITYTQTDRPGDQGFFKILQNNLNQTNDVGMNMRMGMYANRTLYVDIENQTFEEVDFKITDLDLKRPPKLLDGIEDFPTRLMLRVNDFGVAQKGAKKDEVQPISELAVYQNKSYIRNNLLFSQSINISIPLNTTLRAGNLINIRLPVKKDDKGSKTDSYGNERTNDPSGKYLVSELRHLIGGGSAETQLKLIRDVFTA